MALRPGDRSPLVSAIAGAYRGPSDEGRLNGYFRANKTFLRLRKTTWSSVPVRRQSATMQHSQDFVEGLLFRVNSEVPRIIELIQPILKSRDYHAPDDTWPSYPARPANQ